WLTWLRGRTVSDCLRRPEAAADSGPAIVPIQRIEHRRALGEIAADKKRVSPINGGVDQPFLAGVIRQSGVVTRADPAVTVHANGRRAAGAAIEKRDTFAVSIRT